MVTSLQNESALVEAARVGDRAAFNALLNQYSRHIYRLTYNITNNPADAEDAMQEAFLKAYVNLQHFRGDAKFYTWLVRIAVNEALMKLRRRRANNEVSLDEPVSGFDNDMMPREIEDWGESPELRFAQRELQQILNDAIEKLSPIYRVVFLMRDVEQFSTEETAAMLNLSVPAVKARLLRARLMLREDLSRVFKIT